MAVLLEACYLQMTLSVLQRLINVVSKCFLQLVEGSWNWG